MPPKSLGQTVKLKWLNLILIALTLWGGIRFVRAQTKLSELRKDYARVIAAVGEMPIEDGQLLHIKTLESKNAWQWAWRIYQPKNANATVNYQIGNSGSGGSLGFASNEQEFIGRLSLTRLKDGNFGMFTRFRGSSGLAGFGSKEFADFLDKHRSELVIEQIGSDGTIKIAKGDPPQTLFRLSLPDKLAREAEQLFAASGDLQFIPVLVEMKIELR